MKFYTILTLFQAFLWKKYPFKSIKNASAEANAFLVLTITFATKIELGGNKRRRTELRGRKRHIFEYSAGVILLGRDTLLVGNAILCCADKILCGTNDANDREYTERDGKISSLSVDKSAVDLGRDRLGNVVTATTATAAAVVRLANLGGKNDGINHLYDRRGNVLRGAYGLGDSTVVREIGAALEHTYVALSTKKNNALLEYCNTLKFLTSAAAQTRLEGYLDVELDGDRIKSAIEFYRINTDIGPGNAGILRANVGCMLDDIVAEVGKQNLYVLKAVAVAAGIEYAICFNAYRFAFWNVLINTARKSVILHR